MRADDKLRFARPDGFAGRFFFFIFHAADQQRYFVMQAQWVEE